MPQVRQWHKAPYFNAGNTGIGFKSYFALKGQWRIDPYFNAGNAGIGFKPYISPEGAKENVMGLIPPPFQGGTIIKNSLPQFKNRGYMSKPLCGKTKN